MGAVKVRAVGTVLKKDFTNFDKRSCMENSLMKEQNCGSYKFW